jgi:hypothetical protein
MAGQLQVVHSSNIVGAGLVAGGPYGCAETGSEGIMPSAAKNVTQALEGCMSEKLRSECSSACGKSPKVCKCATN